MPAWRLELQMDIQMLFFQTLRRPAKPSSSVAACLWIFLVSVLPAETERHVLLGWDQVTDFVIEKYVFFALKTSWVAFMLCITIYLHFEALCDPFRSIRLRV